MITSHEYNLVIMNNNDDVNTMLTRRAEMIRYMFEIGLFIINDIVFN